MHVRIIVALIFIASLLGCEKPSHRFQGYVEGENIYLASPYSGKLIGMPIVRGQRVKKGDLLYRLDPKPQLYLQRQSIASVNQSFYLLADLIKPKRPPEIAAIEAQISQVNAQIALAALRVKRNSILFDKHVMDKDTLDAAVEHHNEVQDLKAQYEANLALAKLGARADQIDAQKAQLKLAQAKQEEMEWEARQKIQYAPADGIVYDTYYQMGEFIPSEHAVLSLLTPNNTYIEFFVPLDSKLLLYTGKKITYTYEGSTDSHPAVIGYISPEAEYVPPLVYSRENSNKIVFRVKANVKYTQQIFPGEPVIVTIGPDHAG